MEERYGEMGCVNQKGQVQTTMYLVSPLLHIQKRVCVDSPGLNWDEILAGHKDV